MAGRMRKNFGHMGNLFGHGGIQGCPRAGSGFGRCAILFWCLIVSVSVPEGFGIGTEACQLLAVC